MISVRIDNKMLERFLRNAVSYGNGFLEGVALERLNFNRVLAGVTVEALGEYIDQKARMNSDTLHHVYEWGQVGNSSARLFNFSVKSGKTFISISGSFLPSKSISETSSEPFVNKADVMENKIAITITPKNSEVLAFESEGEMVFTSSDVYIANPGGDMVAGSFGSVVDEFFQQYFTSSILRQLLADLRTPQEFSRLFPQGVESGGRSVGVAAGRKYFKVRGAGLNESF